MKFTSKALSIGEFVQARNSSKHLFTAGPASLLTENITGLRPCFGRGDRDYDEVEHDVLQALKGMTGHSNITRFQGSASLALEIAISNFVYGNVLVVDTGFYSRRLHSFATTARKAQGEITSIDSCDWRSLDEVAGRYDWIVGCYTETSRGVRVPMEHLIRLKAMTGGKLLLDATASIGLEDAHENAEVIAYSSCKGLFGLTGAAFVAFDNPPQVQVNSFYLSLNTHTAKLTTGPYHAISSLHDVLTHHGDLKSAVATNKARCLRDFANFVDLDPEYQPQLCTYLTCKLVAKNLDVILYVPRDLTTGSIVCHLGEVHLGTSAKGEILEMLECS